MYKSISLKKLCECSPFWIICGWSLLLLANFIPALPQPAPTVGYLWKVEFALAGLIFLTLIYALGFAKDKSTFVRFHRREILWIIAPLSLFTLWSGLSCFWAESWRNAFHHTLLWACFSICYLLVRQIVAQPRLLDAALKCTGLMITILGFACFVEYLGNHGEVNSIFTFRYFKYAEAAVTLLPIYLALALKLKSRPSFLCGAVAVIAWLMVLLSYSRAVFVAGFVCLGLFFAQVFLFTEWKKCSKKLVLILSILFLCALVTQTSIFKSQKTATINRFVNDEHGQKTLDWRFLIWGITLESFKEKPLQGLGADNFIIDYRTARENYSNLDRENRLLGIDEIIIAERSHNEYLQILAELGIVGSFFFAWLLLGIVRLAVSMRRKSVSLLSIASLAGIAGFLVSSLASSYSFRLPANGVCFFFLLAVAANGLRGNEEPAKEKKIGFSHLRYKPAFVGLAMVICFAMLAFSAVRGVSLMHIQNSLISFEEVEAEEYLRKAIAIDDQEATFRYCYGARLLGWQRAEEAIPEMRFAIDNGIATPISYFYLAAAQTAAGKKDDAEQTFSEGLRLYPHSIFFRTAYASFLKQNGRDLQAQDEFHKAFQKKPELADSWWVAHNEGLTKLSQVSNQNGNFIKAMDLTPAEGVHALQEFQKQSDSKLASK